MGVSEIREVRSSAGERFERLIDIYESSIPLRERRKRDELVAFTQSDHHRILVVEDGADVLAFSIVFLAQRAPMALLDYMATRATARNAGLGSRLFRASLAAAQSRRMFIEIDSDRERSDDQAIRTRRKNFYLREGCLLIDGLDYLLPLPGAGNPPVMDLLVHPNGCGPSISKPDLHHCLDVLFEDAYARPAGDPRIKTMLDGVADPAILKTMGQ